jgi:fumarate hydratase class II
MGQSTNDVFPSATRVALLLGHAALVDAARALAASLHRKASEFTSFAQDLQRFNSQALELIRRGARLIGPAAQHGRACALHPLRSLQQLLARFHRAGTSNDDHFGTADSYASRLSSSNFDHRRLRPRLTADELKRLGDRDDIVHARGDRKGLDFVAAPTAADCRNDGALGATRDVGWNPASRIR